MIHVHQEGIVAWSKRLLKPQTLLLYGAMEMFLGFLQRVSCKQCKYIFLYKVRIMHYKSSEGRKFKYIEEYKHFIKSCYYELRKIV